MYLRLITPIVTLVFGIIILIASFLLPTTQFGDPNAPKYFPLLISIILIAMSLIDFKREWTKRHVSLGILEKLKAGRTPRLLIGTIILCIIYSFIFDKIGFLISTILFIGAEFFLVNGYKKWLTNILTAFLFTIALWYGFAKLLGINLP